VVRAGEKTLANGGAPLANNEESGMEPGSGAAGSHMPISIVNSGSAGNRGMQAKPDVVGEFSPHPESLSLRGFLESLLRQGHRIMGITNDCCVKSAQTLYMMEFGIRNARCRGAACCAPTKKKIKP